MKQQSNYETDKQQGIALPIVMVILVLSALIVLYLANTSRKEQQISADQYRTEQSFNAAMAGLDWAIDYYNAKGLDADENDSVDFGPGGDNATHTWYIGSDVSALTSASASGDLIVKTEAFYCDVFGPNKDSNFWSNPELCAKAPDIGIDETVGVVAVGYSDDDTARRVITVVLAGAPILPPAGPGQPLTTKSNVGFTGNITIINRYFNSTINSGGPVRLDASAIETYIGDPDDPDVGIGVDRFDSDPSHRIKMTETKEAGGVLPGALSASVNKRGNNFDVLENDSVLASLCTDCTGARKDEFFQYFLDEDKATIESAAKGISGHHVTDCDQLDDGITGIVWVELGAGVTCKTKINFGSFDEPAAVFINGNLDLGGTVDLYGLLYVTGDLTIVGNPTIKGSVIVEGGFKTDKAGNLDLVYDPVAMTPGPGLIGRRSFVFGTWKDWGI